MCFVSILQYIYLCVAGPLEDLPVVHKWPTGNLQATIERSAIQLYYGSIRCWGPLYIAYT